jgi:hypothetical protein
VNASIFGSSNVVNAPDNGIDFSNIKIEFTSVPEPSSLLLSAIGVAVLRFARRRR